LKQVISESPEINDLEERLRMVLKILSHDDPDSEVFHVLWYFILASILHVAVLAVSQIEALSNLHWLATWTPNIAAVTITALMVKEKNGVRNLLSGWTKWRVGTFWYIVALSPLFMGLLAAGIYRILGNTPPGPLMEYDWKLIAFLLVLSLLTGASGEELGWRGFALPRLQTRFSALTSSLILGLMWSLWHLPVYLPSFESGGVPYWWFTAHILAESIIYTWAYNNTGGSLVISTLLHMVSNFSNGLFLLTGLITLEAGMMIVLPIYILYSLAVVFVYGSAKLSRAP
jgi:membrane protease YdiL (CAAX protease family)